jgi:DNA helicase IV
MHNEARPAAARAVIELVAGKYADKLGENVLGGANLLGEGDVAALRREVAAEPAVHALIDRLWPRLTAERLVSDLLASPERLAAATPGWDDADRALLHRPASAPWTAADVPLLEEADELLGVDDSARERAAADRTWTYGHVIVDEAQELSAMAWRTLLRKNPTRSMTVVGDVAQTGSSAGAASWAEVLDPQLDKGWRLEELTVNYRTPTEIMAVADAVRGASSGNAVRSTGIQPWSLRADADLPEAVAEAAAEFDKEEGTLGVVVPPSRFDAVVEAIGRRLPGISDDLTEGPVVLTPTGVKGLEFDSVLVVDPVGIVAEGVRGHNDLYVALTRATQRLGILHPGTLPDPLYAVVGI